MKIWKPLVVLASIGAVVGVGAMVFLSSRKAAAAEAGSKALKVSPDCLDVEVVDQAELKTAVAAALPVAFGSLDEPAWKLVVRVLGFITKCPVQDAMKLRNLPGVPMTVTVAIVKWALGDMTVSDALARAREGNLDIGAVGATPEQASPAAGNLAPLFLMLDPWVTA